MQRPAPTPSGRNRASQDCFLRRDRMRAEIRALRAVFPHRMIRLDFLVVGPPRKIKSLRRRRAGARPKSDRLSGALPCPLSAPPRTPFPIIAGSLHSTTEAPCPRRSSYVPGNIVARSASVPDLHPQYQETNAHLVALMVCSLTSASGSMQDR